MYAAARRGEEIERTPATVTIHAIRLTRFELPDVEFEVECGAGTYIRAIARDAGEALGVGGHLRTLRRTAVGPHSVEGAVPITELGDAERVAAAMIAPLDALAHMPRVAVDEAGLALLRHGRAVPASPETPAGVPLALASGAGELLAVGDRHGDVVRPRKVFIAGS
jgi:tRNA pseudouridine55 synthase